MKALKPSLCVLLMWAAVSVYAQNVQFDPSNPEAGSTLKFTYNPAGTKLDKAEDITCRAYNLTGNENTLAKITFKKESGVYKGEAATTDSTALLLLSFSAGRLRDDNPNGYYIALNKNNRSTAQAVLAEAYLLSGLGQALAGIKPDLSKAMSLFQQAFKQDSSLKGANKSAYYIAAVRADQQSSLPEIETYVSSLFTSTDFNEEELVKGLDLIKAQKDKAKADSLSKAIIKRYPTGTLAYNEDMRLLYREPNGIKLEQLFNDLVKKFDLDESRKLDSARLASLYFLLGSKYARDKNNEKFILYTDQVKDKERRASMYNSYAWAGAEKKENLEFASAISKKSMDLLQSAKNDPVPPRYKDQAAYQKSLDGTSATYADTYALLLFHQGKNEEALSFQEKAVTHNNYGSADMNGRYVEFLVANNQREKAFAMAEKFVQEGKSNESVKTELKKMYASQNKAVPYDTYIAGLEKIASEHQKKEMAKTILNMPAPDFSLLNLKGEEVKLASLKGKVVILDYWATWCGPCIMSFPGMQQAVTKYADSPDVVFLFINSWERGENRVKNVTDFISKNKYTFNVLMDTPQKTNPDQFEVIDDYEVEGIPTKFVVGPDGKIRFKAVGFSGSADALVKELDVMIDLARNFVSNTP